MLKGPVTVAPLTVMLAVLVLVKVNGTQELPDPAAKVPKLYVAGVRVAVLAADALEVLTSSNTNAKHNAKIEQSFRFIETPQMSREPAGADLVEEEHWHVPWGEMASKLFGGSRKSTILQVWRRFDCDEFSSNPPATSVLSIKIRHMRNFLQQMKQFET